MHTPRTKQVLAISNNPKCAKNIPNKIWQKFELTWRPTSSDVDLSWGRCCCDRDCGGVWGGSRSGSTPLLLAEDGWPAERRTMQRLFTALGPGGELFNSDQLHAQQWQKWSASQDSVTAQELLPIRVPLSFIGPVHAGVLSGCTQTWEGLAITCRWPRVLLNFLRSPYCQSQHNGKNVGPHKQLKSKPSKPQVAYLLG